MAAGEKSVTLGDKKLLSTGIVSFQAILSEKLPFENFSILFHIRFISNPWYLSRKETIFASES